METLVARLGRPHGLRGEVTAQVHTDEEDERFVPGTVFDTEDAPAGVPARLTLRATRVHNGIRLLAFEEAPDRTAAEALRGTRLLLDVDPATERDESDDEGWYESELVGLEARDPAGRPIGTVTALQVRPGQDLLVLRLVDTGEALVPFVEAIVPQVDVAGGFVVVDAPPGLLGLGDA